MLDLSGIWVAVVTPFTPSASGLAVDHAALTRMVARLRQAEVNGIVALGSTGEPTSLDDAEQDAVLDTILSAAEGLPVIGGLHGSHVGQLHARMRYLNGLPLHAVLCAPPPYIRPSQPALIAHFTALADLSRAPLVLYDIPYRTGASMSLDTILHLAGHRNVAGLKDCGGCLDKTQRLIADGRLQLLAGEDHLVFHHLALGAAGAITAAAQVAPQAFVGMYRAMQQGDLARARAAHHRLAPAIRALFAEPNPAVIKRVLADRGVCDAAVRPPLLAASDASLALAMAAIPA